ncbi:MAG TPA: peptidyl-alpha-hydroxyglycine alpha-amidating lyase family protein [Pirellulales bacterium]|nr:peptidyl-alpha-hydroxyglycine alpha-amidating lyase family protein [Pirellulales bacterium]
MSAHVVHTAAVSALAGAGPFRYQAQSRWCELPAGCEAVAAATDSHDQVYVFNRSEQPVRVFAPEGRFLRSWGEGVFTAPHGIHIGPDDAVYCTDYFDHTVRKFTPEGRLLMTLGVPGRFSDTGATSVDYRHIRRAAGPFNFPTNLAVAPRGELFVADGYGNARIHVFSPAGELLHSFGSPGDGPGEFHVPHGIAIDAEGVVYVADRENSRIQRFTPGGQFIDQWRDVARPCEVFIDRQGRIFTAELGYRAGMFPGNEPPTANATGGRVSVFSPDGTLLARFGGGENPCAAGDFFAPHDIWVDSRGDFYVSEVVYTAGVSRGLIGPDCHTLQKFVRVEDASSSPNVSTPEKGTA